MKIKERMSGTKQRVVYLMRRTDKVSNGTDVYIGSTSQPLRQRLREHRYCSKICDSKFYTRVRETGAKNWEIISLETVPLCDEEKILALEKEWIERLKPDLNKNFPVRKNNERSRESARRHRLRSLEEKRYYCRTCEKVFGGVYHLQKHIKTLKHQRACLNSLR